MPIIRQHARQTLEDPSPIYVAIADALLTLVRLDDTSFLFVDNEAGLLRLNELWEVLEATARGVATSDPNALDAWGSEA